MGRRALFIHMIVEAERNGANNLINLTGNSGAA